MSDLAWLDEIEAMANAATPGPWVASPDWAADGEELPTWGVSAPDAGTELVFGAEREEDAQLMAHARDDVLRLCRAVRELWFALNKTVATIRTCTDYWPDEERVMQVLERWRRGETAHWQY